MRPCWKRLPLTACLVAGFIMMASGATAQPSAGIDIKPGDDANIVNPLGNGVIPVAVLGSDSFDVHDVDVTTLVFGPAGATPAHRSGGHLVGDVNDDGTDDLLSHYATQETGIAFGDQRACSAGETLAGLTIGGCDTIRTVPAIRACGVGLELAFLVPGLMWLQARARSPKA